MLCTKGNHESGSSHLLLRGLLPPWRRRQPLKRTTSRTQSRRRRLRINRRQRDRQAQPGSPSPTQPPPREALVYVIETMPDVPFVTKKVNIGLDGSWIGATDAMTHMSFPVDPGVHHLCAVYQGHAASMDDEGQILLLRLNAEAGHIYYIRYHAMFLKDSPGIAFFEKVDDDEGLLLLQDSDDAVSTLKK
jgi:hypothetical protein